MSDVVNRVCYALYGTNIILALTVFAFGDGDVDRLVTAGLFVAVWIWHGLAVSRGKQLDALRRRVDWERL